MLRRFSATALACFFCAVVGTAQERRQPDGGYAAGFSAPRDAATVNLEQSRNWQSEKIDTSQPPKPDKDYIDTLSESTGHAGGFFRGKGGNGHMITRGGHPTNPVYVANSLKGYGTTANYVVYEVTGFSDPGTNKKVYHAFMKKNPSAPTTYALVLVSGTKDNPTDLSSFVEFGYATRGEKKGNMTE